MYLHAYLPGSIDGPTASSDLASDRPVVVGRVGRAAHRLEPLLGRAVVAQCIGIDRPVDALVLSVEDPDARLLLQADTAGASIFDVVAAYRLLRKAGLTVAMTARALGVRRKDEASRLGAIAKLDERILRDAAELGMTAHHLRWACGKPPESVLTAIKRVAPRRPTVAEFKAVMGGLQGRRVLQVLDTEGSRLSEWLGAPAQVIWDGEGGVIDLTYFSAEELIGLLERLVEKRRTDASAPKPSEARTLSIAFRSSAEYDYLVGGDEAT